MWSYVFLMFCEVEVYVPGCVSVKYVFNTEVGV